VEAETDNPLGIFGAARRHLLLIQQYQRGNVLEYSPLVVTILNSQIIISCGCVAYAQDVPNG
jgi:hypothetical protein